MNAQLCISVTFLDSLFHGKGDDWVEWPPSPMRLFQALIAGAHSGCRGHEWSEAKASAFRWLENCSPPLIVAPAALPMRGYTFFVPDNIADRPEFFEREKRLIGKPARPHRLLDGDTVHYLWPIDGMTRTAAPGHSEVLCGEARHLTALGWGIDQVVGNGRILTDAEASGLEGDRWCPWNVYRPETRTWRVPTPGALDHLQMRHQSIVKRMETKQYLHPIACYRTVYYLRASTLPPRPYAVFELPEGIAFRQENIVKIAAMLRSLASRCAREDTHQFPGSSETYVAGHVGQESETPARFSYLPLPTIGHDHADGMIRRLLIAEPFGGDSGQARWAQSRLRNATLRAESGEERGILRDLWRSTSRTLLEQYVDPAKVWSTVTPVILPGFDDGKHSKAEKLFMAAVRQAGMPSGAVKDVILRKAPFWPGSQNPRQYFLPDYLRRGFSKGLPGWHVRLVLHEDLAGPWRSARAATSAWGFSPVQKRETSGRRSIYSGHNFSSRPASRADAE
jgi:CRISPR-associated protein Csb2